MSIEELAEDVLHGNFAHAEQRIEDWYSGLPPWVQDFVTTAKTAQGQILTSLAEVAAQDVMNGGFTGASFLAAIADVGMKLAAQEISFGEQQIYAAVNLAAHALKNPAPVIAGVPPAPPPAP